jgi:hypothetical protein
MTRVSLLLLALLPACGGPTVVDDPLAEPPAVNDPGVVVDPTDTEHADRFVGEWVLSQPFHATYEATRYRFWADGALEHLEAFPDGYDVGRAVITDDSACAPDDDPYFCTQITACTFADRWRSRGDDVLVVEADCDDGAGREIEVRFVTAASGNSDPGAMVEVVRVGEVTEGTLRDGFEWVWQRCADDDGVVLTDHWAFENIGLP